MTLTPELVAAYKELIVNPKNNGLSFQSINDFFKKSETVIAKHELAEAYISHTAKGLPKVVLYIIMDEIFGQCDGKDEKGNLGYHLSIA